MADDVVLPVLHPAGEVHNISMPADTTLPELHDALLDGGYALPGGISKNWAPYMDPKVDPVSGRPRPDYGPKKEGALEYDPKFKAALAKVWEAAGYGKNSTESGTYIDSNLDRGPISTSNTDGRMTVTVPDDAPYTVHSHPNHFKDGDAGGQPSDKDIATAKGTKKYVYVVSRSGLQYVGPHGEQGVVYTNPSQFTEKK